MPVVHSLEKSLNIEQSHQGIYIINGLIKSLEPVGIDKVHVHKMLDIIKIH